MIKSQVDTKHTAAGRRICCTDQVEIFILTSPTVQFHHRMTLMNLLMCLCCLYNEDYRLTEQLDHLWALVPIMHHNRCFKCICQTFSFHSENHWCSKLFTKRHLSPTSTLTTDVPAQNIKQTSCSFSFYMRLCIFRNRIISYITWSCDY